MSSDFGYGQQQPADANSEFNKIAFAVRQIIARISTMKVVQIVAVHGGGLAPVGAVDVLPLVRMVDGNNNSSPHGVVYGLPYFRLQGGANAVICDPVVGDIGLAVISDRDISAVKSTKAVANPGSFRKFDLADGVYVGGILNTTPTQFVEFTDTGVTIADMNGNEIQMLPGSVNIVTAVFTVNGTPVTIP